MDFASGEVILVDKPLTWTSFDVVNKLKYALKPQKIKIGHAGTLDPLATGLLIICTGKKTKEIELYQSQVKVYSGKFLVGNTTPSFDLETEIDQEFPTEHIDGQLLEKARLLFLGKISQVPPVFSAVKVNGKRAYESARKGIDVEIKPRELEIFSFEINTENFPEVGFEIICSKGTYIRSIARDFGIALGSGAHLIELRREGIGQFSVQNAWSVDQAIETIKKYNENLPQTK